MTVRTQTRYPTTVVSDDAVGTLPWSNPDKAEVEDNDPATATGPGISEWLKCTGYGFNLPSTATPTTALLKPRRRTVTTGLQTIELVGEETAVAVGSDTWVQVDVPAGTTGDGQPGSHVMILTASRLGGSFPGGNPAGWTSLGNAGSANRAWIWARVANNEPASYTITLGDVSSIRSATITTWSGVDTTAIRDPAGTSTNGPSSGTGHSSSSLTTTVAGVKLLKFDVLYLNPGTVTAPSGMSQVAQGISGANLRATVYAETLGAAGATGVRTTTTTNSVESIRFMIGLRPAPAYATDSAARIVVEDLIGDDDYSDAAEWSASYESPSLGPIDISEVAVADINATDFGCALSATAVSTVVAGIDAVPITVTYDVAVDVTITAPTSDLTAPNAEVTWDAEVDGTPVTQASSRVRVLARPSLAVLYDSGVIAGATQAHAIGSGSPSTPWASPQNGQAIRIEVTVTEDGTADPNGTGDPISGTATFDCVTDWTLPTAPTGLAAVAVTEAP